MPDVDELIIPVRFDGGHAAQDLKKVESAGKAAGDSAAGGMDRASRGARGLSDQLVNITKAQIGLSAVRAVATAMGSEFKRAADYVATLGKEFAGLRESIQEVAALSGQQNSNQFTVEQARKAASVGMTPQEWNEAQAGFLNPAASQVSEKGKGLQPGRKMTAEQAEEYELRVAALLKSKGIKNAAPGMEFAGSILTQSKEPLSVEQAMEQFNKGFEVLQKGQIQPSRGPGMMSEVMAQGLSAQQAATVLSIVAPAAPNEEATSAGAALRAMEEMRLAGKGEQFGVKDTMNKYESLKAFGANVVKRERALKAAGKTDPQIEDEIARQLKQADVAAEIREKRGLVRGIAHFGVELGGFGNYEKVAADTSADADRQAVADFRRSSEGRAAQRRADLAMVRTERASKREDVVAELEDTGIDLTRAGELEKARLTALVGEKGASLSGVSPEQQLINERTLGRLRNRAAALGITDEEREAPMALENRDLLRGQTDRNGYVPSADVWMRHQEDVDGEVKSLLRLIADKIDEGNKKGAAPPAPAPAAPQAPRPANRPLVMPAPAPGGGRRQ